VALGTELAREPDIDGRDEPGCEHRYQLPRRAVERVRLGTLPTRHGRRRRTLPGPLLGEWTDQGVWKGRDAGAERIADVRTEVVSLKTRLTDKIFARTNRNTGLILAAIGAAIALLRLT
jgi:hypothetical protein